MVQLNLTNVSFCFLLFFLTFRHVHFNLSFSLCLTHSDSQRYLNDNPIASQRAPANNLQASEDRNRILMELLQRQSDEIRMLKQRMSNLIIENDVNDVNDVNDECINASTSLPWTNSELCKAFCLQRLNIPLFNHLRKKFSVPLPSVDEVRKFIRNIQFVRELQPTILQILEYDGQILQDHEKFTILQVSYIKTADIFEYDESSDLIWGPHKFFAVIVARGLYKEWSQVVYMNFDTRVTKANLINVIEALHRISYPVVAVSANFEEGRNDIFHELSIGYGKNFFSHPLTTEKIFCFYYLNDLLQATNTHFCAGNLQLDETNSTDTTQRSKHILSKQVIESFSFSNSKILIEFCFYLSFLFLCRPFYWPSKTVIVKFRFQKNFSHGLTTM